MFCGRWFPKMLTGAHRTYRMASASIEFFTAKQQIWRRISESHCTSNTWWNRGLICECWNQGLVNAVGAHTFNKEAEKFKQALSACQKAESNCFLGLKRSAYGGIHATRDHNKVRSVLRNTKEPTYGHSEQNTWNSDIRCSTPPWQCASGFEYSSSHLSTAGAFQLGVVWPPSLQPWSCSEQLSPIYLPE
jgi:hypothetical protein